MVNRNDKKCEKIIECCLIREAVQLELREQYITSVWVWVCMCITNGATKYRRTKFEVKT